MPDDTKLGLPARDTTKPAEQQGLFRKFDVRRTDGSSAPGGKHEGCEYFVLDTTHDKLAAVALEAYADACEATHPLLAEDLRKRYGLAALPAEPTQRPALVPALHGLLASLSRQPTEFELRAAAHEFSVITDLEAEPGQDQVQRLVDHVDRHASARAHQRPKAFAKPVRDIEDVPLLTRRHGEPNAHVFFLSTFFVEHGHQLL